MKHNSSTNRTASQPTNPPTNQITNRSTNRSTNQPTDRPIDRPTDQTTNQPINRPTNQSSNQPTSQPTNRKQKQKTISSSQLVRTVQVPPSFHSSSPNTLSPSPLTRKRWTSTAQRQPSGALYDNKKKSSPASSTRNPSPLLPPPGAATAAEARTLAAPVAHSHDRDPGRAGSSFASHTGRGKKSSRFERQTSTTCLSVCGFVFSRRRFGG